MKKIDVNKIPMKEIISEFGVGVDYTQIFGIISDFDEYFRRGYKIREKVNPEEFLIKNEDIIHKEKLMYHELLDMKSKLDFYKRNIKNDSLDLYIFGETLKAFEKCFSLMQNSQVEIPRVTIETDGKADVEKILVFKDLTEKEKKREQLLKEKNLGVLREMKEQGIERMIMLLTDYDDLTQFLCNYKGNGEVFKFVIKQRIMQELKKKENVNKSDSEKEDQARNEKINYMLELMNKFPEKFNMDNLLLITAYRAKQVLENNKNINDESIVSKLSRETMQFAEKNIENPKARISDMIWDDSLRKKVPVNYKYKDLEKDVSRIINGRYFSKEDLGKIREELFSGELEFGASSREFMELLNLTKEEKSEIVKVNPNNFESFVMAGMLDRDEVINMLENMEEGIELPNSVINCMCCDNLFENRDFVDMYMRKQINLKQFCRLHEFYELQSNVTVDELMQYYENREQTQEQEIDFEKYALLFREIRLKNSDEEEKQQIAEQIMEKLYETERDYDADLKNLYGVNLLPIRTLIDWNGDKMIYDLIGEASIKPKDAKELLMTGELDVPKAYQALKNSNLSDAEKLNFIFSSFDGVGNTPEEMQAQNEARMYLIQAMNISKDFVEHSKTTSSHTTRQKSETKQKGNRYVSDPVYRWQLFSQIDKDCDSKPFADGSVVFTLPNVGNGTTVVEKLFKSTQKGTQINYGSATYCMTEEAYLNHKDEIEREGKINRKALIQMHKEEKASRAVHSKAWGRDLKKTLGLFVENGYTPEKIAEIDGLIEQIENSKELVR